MDWDIEGAMARKGMSLEVRARIRRLNPNHCQGDRVRGWYPAWQASRKFWMGIVSKSRFIREYGRDAWAALPRGAIRKNGKRCYVDCRVVDDRLWMMLADHLGRK